MRMKILRLIEQMLFGHLGTDNASLPLGILESRTIT